jgi:hypothetical protein
LCLILLAGWREEAGRGVEARLIARRGGFGMAIGATLQVVSAVLWYLAARDLSRSAVWSAVIAMLATGLSGFVGLLAGLSGKPRPSGGFAAVLFLTGLLTAAVAVGQSFSSH